MKEPAYYVIRDDNLPEGEQYYSRRFGYSLNDAQARYVSSKNARNDVIKIQSSGYDVSKVVVVPVFLTEGEPIKPKVMEQKSGYAIQITEAAIPGVRKGYHGHKPTTYYWKGNKRKPVTDGYEAFSKRVPAIIKATILSSEDEANDRLAELQALKVTYRQKLIDDEETRKSRWHPFYPGDKYYPQPYVEQLDRLSLKVVKI